MTTTTTTTLAMTAVRSINDLEVLGGENEFEVGENVGKLVTGGEVGIAIGVVD